MPGGPIPARQLALFGIAFIPLIVLLILDRQPLVILWVIGLPVLGVSVICSVWWFISIPRGARWLEFRPTARRRILTGFVLTVVALVLSALFWDALIFALFLDGILPGIFWRPSLGNVAIVWPIGLYATCFFWWSIVRLPDVRWREFRLTWRWVVSLGFLVSGVGGIWRGVSPDNVLGPHILLFGGMGPFYALVVMFWGSILYGLFANIYREFTRLYGEFTGRTRAAAPAPSPSATQPVASASPPPPAPAPVPVAAPAPPPLAPAPAAPALPPSVICPWCGHSNPANSIYCGNGACLAPLSSGRRFCIRCGVPFPVNARFCTACGSSA